MAFVFHDASSTRASVSRPLVLGLFAASCLLSIVSFYTTQQGMMLYLSPWFATLASLGVQSALVLTAWLVGFERSGRSLLAAVYAVTALISIAFSYVSLHQWFTVRERPALVARALFDDLNLRASQAAARLDEAASRARQYSVALEEMTAAERTHGHISQSGDADPYLNSVRQAVAQEASALGAAYRQGSGEGARYTAFERHAKLTRASLAELEAAQRSLAAWRNEAAPGMPAEEQLRRFSILLASLPWATVNRILGQDLAPPAAPPLSLYVQRAASGQEELMRSFEELFAAPTSRHIFSLALAAFIDVIVFLLAFAAGPHFHAAPAERLRSAAAAIDDADEQILVRDLLRKVQPGDQGLAEVDAALLTPGQRQLCLSLTQSGAAVIENTGAGTRYLLDRGAHSMLMESLSTRGLPLRAFRHKATA